MGQAIGAVRPKLINWVGYCLISAQTLKFSLKRVQNIGDDLYGVS
jgi:hypothetical protein